MGGGRSLPPLPAHTHLQRLPKQLRCLVEVALVLKMHSQIHQCVVAEWIQLERAVEVLQRLRWDRRTYAGDNKTSVASSRAQYFAHTQKSRTRCPLTCSCSPININAPERACVAEGEVVHSCARPLVHVAGTISYPTTVTRYSLPDLPCC